MATITTVAITVATIITIRAVATVTISTVDVTHRCCRSGGGYQTVSLTDMLQRSRKLLVGSSFIWL
ncbi:hypothetical protein E2C01_076447 [Portunus trituberculatus]|uniref:Uncharacterized protein n=1 Tax=Portunus trituberculatus TaxID=210409 RepID=A0A5B7ID86_PORTR|nr:hypothetical protein [Portunus trituberculatus]